MRRASITIPDDLGRALDKYLRDLEAPPSLASVVQAALRGYLEERGYHVETGEVLEDEPEIIPSEGGKPKGLRGDAAPKLKGGPTIAETVIEDRR